MSFTTALVCVVLTISRCLAANTAPGVPVSLLITVESKSEKSPILSADDVRVEENRETRPITAWKHVDVTSPTQLLILVDDSAGGSFDSQLSDLKDFVSKLPGNVEVGVGYMRNGMSQMVAPFTNDHASAAKAIRIAEGAGGADVSPYDSLQDAVNKWPVRPDVMRKEVIMISSGIEGLGGGLPPDNPYVNAGINAAIKVGVTVYAIYNPSSGHAGHSFWQGAWGQNLLSQLTDETGGELYWLGSGSAVSFQPYFEDFLKRQSEQYILTFDARAEKKSGLQPIKVRAAVKGTSLAAPEKVFVKAGL